MKFAPHADVGYAHAGDGLAGDILVVHGIETGHRDEIALRPGDGITVCGCWDLRPVEDDGALLLLHEVFCDGAGADSGGLVEEIRGVSTEEGHGVAAAFWWDVLLVGLEVEDPVVDEPELAT